MAKTPAEKQRAYRQGLKSKARQEANATDDLPGSTFEQYLRAQDNFDPPPDPWNHTWRDLKVTLDYVGIDIAKPVLLETEWEAHEENPRGALGRAERLVSTLLDGAAVLSELINRFKLEKIEQAIAQIKEADLSDPSVRTKALDDLVELKALQARLNKRTGVKGLHAIY